METHTQLTDFKLVNFICTQINDTKPSVSVYTHICTHTHKHYAMWDITRQNETDLNHDTVIAC